MKSELKNNYAEENQIARSPTLQTVLMVEKFIDENSGEFKKTEILKCLITIDNPNMINE